MRNPITYRSERRNDWRTLHGVTWQEHNAREQGGIDRWHIGSMQSNRVTMRSPARSRYNPHNGKQEMARRVRQISAA